MEKGLSPTILGLIADHDQDLSRCDTWMKEHDEQDMILVWRRIIRRYPDPVDEVMSRFAQLGFIQAVIRMESAKTFKGG